MNFTRISLALGCALNLAGCAQSGFGGSPNALAPGASVLPGTAHATLPLGKHRRSSGAPEIYVFAGYPDASAPLTGLANLGNTLYGTTYEGGASNEGALYSVTTGGVETVIHNFPTGSNDGYSPDAAVTAVDGTLYGTTYYGGANGAGILYSITPPNSY